MVLTSWFNHGLKNSKKIQLSDVKSSASEKLDQAFCDLWQGHTLLFPGSQVSSGGSSLPKTLQHQGTSCCCSYWPKSWFGFFMKWHGKMRTNFLANPIITASEIAPFFFFFALDTVWSSRQSHWLITVPWKVAPWPDGCNISERATQCVWIANLQLWTPWAFVVLVMAWTLTGKGEELVGGFFLALIWGDMASSPHAQQTSMRSGESQQWGEASIWPFQSVGSCSHSRT